METQLTETQKGKINNAIILIRQAEKLVDEVDDELQAEGSTGPNPINYISNDLSNTAYYLDGWLVNGVEL